MLSLKSKLLPIDEVKAGLQFYFLTAVSFEQYFYF